MKPNKLLYSKTSKRWARLKCIISVILCMLGISLSTLIEAQTTLLSGDVAIVGLNAANPDKFSVVLLKDITTNTVINFTDNGFTGTNTTGRTGEGFLTYTSPTNQTAGSVITWSNGMTITGTGWSSAAPTNFAFNASGDQLFAFQGATANWATQSGITLIFGMNYGVALTATSGAGNTLQPDISILPSNSFLNLPTATFANSYFANGSASQTAVTVSGTALNILTLISDATKWFGNSATASTFPTFTFNVTSGGTPTIAYTGTLSALSTTYGTPSSETTFDVSGLNLTAGILITPPLGYEASLVSGGIFTSTLTVGSGGTISSTPIYIRLTATAIPGSYAGDIVLTSSGATPINVATVSSIVNTKNLTITGITANNKIFDGNTSATLSGTPVLNGVETADLSNVNVSGTPLATFANSTVGTAIPVTVTGYTLAGSASANYTLTQPSLSANITPAGLLNQTITFNVLPNVTYGDASFTLTATASSGLLVSYTSSNTAVATISGNTVTIIGVGSTNITASQAGNASYNPAPSVIQALTVVTKPLTLTGAIALNKIYDANTDALISGSVVVGIVGSEVVNVSGSGLFATSNVGTGIAVVSTQTLSGANAANYSLVLPTGLTADITQASQTITFGALPNKAVGDAPFALNATVNSSLTISYASSNTSVATVAGNIVTIVGIGTTNITASQAGDGNYSAAVDAIQTLTVNATSSPTTLAAGDIAIIGYNTNGTPDNLAILVMKDLNPGTVFYVGDNEIATAGGTTFTDLNEAEASFTVNPGQTILAGTVITLPWGSTAVSTSSYSWSATSGAGLGNNNDELYVYTASTITSTTPTAFIYFAKIGTSVSSIPVGLTIGSTSIATAGSALRYSTSGALYTGCVSAILSAIGNTATDWNTTGATAILATDWTFSILPTCVPTISTSGSLSSLTTTYGTASTETMFNVSGNGLTAGILVTPPAGYEVSLTSGGTFSSLLTFGSGGNISATTIYVRLSASSTAGIYTGDIILSSAGASNVNVSTPTSAVNQKDLTITGITANNKSFDGNTNATLSGTALLNGVLASDISNVNLGGTPMATFASSAIGVSIAVTVTGYTISGSAALNYSLLQPSGLTANITSASLLNQSITFNALSPVVYGDASFALSASASSGLVVSYVSSNTNVATVSGNTITIIAPGATTIIASQAGDASYNPASNVSQTLVVNPKQLTVIGANTFNKVYDSTTAAVIFGSTLVGIVGSDIVTINGDGIFATPNVGTAIAVTSAQVLGGADSFKYSVVLPTGLTADITQAIQSITFGALANKTTADAPFNLNATSTSGLPITYTSSNLSVATILGNVVTIVGAGTTNIIASQVSDNNFSAAVDVVQTLNVTAALAAGDIALIGYNTSGVPDNIALLILKDLTSGTTFYVNDNEVTTAGGTSFADLNEAEASFTVNAGQTITAGTIVVLPWGSTAVTNTLYTWSTTAGAGLGNNNDEIHIYTAPSITSSTPTTFIYSARIGTSTSAIPSNLILGTTFISPSGSSLRYSTTGALYVGCIPALLSAIGNTTTNWNITGATTIADTDWSFIVTPNCANISTAGTPLYLTTTYGTASSETSFDVSGIGMNAGILVTPPAGFEVALNSGGPFTSTITVGAAGIITFTTVYLRLTSSTIPGTYAGDIVLSSLGAINMNVPSTSSIVNPKPITITGLSANNKIFNGNTNATLSGTATLVGVEIADLSNVSLGGTPIATFTNAAVGTGIAVSVTGYTLSGSASAYYILTQPSLTADILPTGLLNQTITFNPLSQVTYGSTPFSLSAASTSGLATTFTSSNLNVATVAGNLVTIVGAGSTAITASQGGNSTYNPAINILQTLIVNPKQLTVSGSMALDKVYDGNAIAIVSGSVLNGIVGSDVVMIDNSGTFAAANAGTGIAVTSTQTISGANALNYSVLLPSGLTANILKASQTITFGPLSNKATTDTPFVLTATASSGLAIIYASSNPLVASVSGNIVTIVGAGTTNITASQSGDNNYLAASDVVQSLLVTAAPSLTSVIMPQFIQGLNGTNVNRIPCAYLVTLNNLLPNATYRYINQAVISSDAPTTAGAGNVIFANASGFMQSSSPSFTGVYGSLTTDNNGSYTGWFITEPTGNAARFIPGNYVRFRIRLNDGIGGILPVTFLTTSDSVKVINTVNAAGPNNGTGLRGNSTGTPKNLVVLYDNVSGSGRPLAATFIENDGNANTASYIPFYSTSVNGIDGAYAVIIPNSNSNGVQRIEQRSLATGALVGCPATDADGVWPSGANTVNPIGGTTAVVIDSMDASLGNSCGSQLNLTLFIQGYWNGTSAMLPVLSNQGESTISTATDSITVELHDAISPYGIVAMNRTILNHNGTAICDFPTLSGSYFIVIKHRNAIQTWSANPVVFSSITNYDFSVANSQAYGGNQIEVTSGIWALYSGDIVPDENIDLLDLAVLETDLGEFAFGYYYDVSNTNYPGIIPTDINGDGNVDLLDSPALEDNLSNFIFSTHP